MSERYSTQRRQAWRQDGAAPPPDRYGLEPAPIPAEWIVEGQPITRSRRLWSSADEMAFTAMWDCTASRFDWFYDIDETVCILEGSVIVTDVRGERRILRPSDTFFFPSGSRYHWIVPSYVRKIAFIHVPLSPKLHQAQRIYRSLKSWIGAGAARAGGRARPGAALGGH